MLEVHTNQGNAWTPCWHQCSTDIRRIWYQRPPKADMQAMLRLQEQPTAGYQLCQAKQTKQYTNLQNRCLLLRDILRRHRWPCLPCQRTLSCKRLWRNPSCHLHQQHQHSVCVSGHRGCHFGVQGSAISAAVATALWCHWQCCHSVTGVA